MPHKVADKRLPGTAEDKLAIEVAAYVWMQEKMPQIRIPHLYGLGFRGGEQFTHSNHRSIFHRISHSIRRLTHRVLGRPTLSNYTLQTTATAHDFDSSYLLMEYVGEEDGRMLVSTWMENKNSPKHRKNLFRDIAKVMLAVASIPQPHIGSFRFHMDGTIALTARAITASMMVLENGTAPRTMAPDQTFRSARSYAAAMIDFHDQRLLAQPNAVFNEDDCLFQMATHTVFRLHADRYVEGGSTTAAHRLHVPFWVTEGSIDQVCGKGYDAYNEVRQEFMAAWIEIEREMGNSHGFALSQIMERAWKSKTVWFWGGLDSINAMYRLTLDSLCRSLEDEKINKVMARFWSTENCDAIVQRKLKDKEKYDEDLRLLFEKHNPGKVVKPVEKSSPKAEGGDGEEEKSQGLEGDTSANKSKSEVDETGGEAEEQPVIVKEPFG